MPELEILQLLLNIRRWVFNLHNETFTYVKKCIVLSDPVTIICKADKLSSERKISTSPFNQGTKVDVISLQPT